MPANNRSSTFCFHANYALLGYYADSSGNSLPTFRYTLSVPTSKKILRFLTLADGTDRLTRTSVRNSQYSLRNNPAKRSSFLLRSGSLKSCFFVHVSCLKLQRFIAYRTVSMSVVLYRPSTLLLTLWEEHKLRVHQVSSDMFRHSIGIIIRETS
jgi:hypothetical protein